MTAEISITILQDKLNLLASFCSIYGCAEWVRLHGLSETQPPSVIVLCHGLQRSDYYRMEALRLWGSEGWMPGDVVNGRQSVQKTLDGVLVELYQAYAVPTPEPQAVLPVDPALLMGENTDSEP